MKEKKRKKKIERERTNRCDWEKWSKETRASYEGIKTLLAFLWQNIKIDAKREVIEVNLVTSFFFLALHTWKGRFLFFSLLLRFFFFLCLSQLVSSRRFTVSSLELLITIFIFLSVPFSLSYYFYALFLCLSSTFLCLQLYNFLCFNPSTPG